MTGLRFDRRVAVVTGGGRGVGRSHAMLLAAKGASVVVADYGVGIDGGGSSSEPAEEVVREITAGGGQAVACYASVAEPQGAQAIIDTALERFGRVDVVINNAGIHDPGLFEELSVEQFQRMLDVHLFGTLRVCRAAWPHLVAAGYGRIVNTVSEAMLGGISELTSYGAAKGAVFGLTRNLATEGIAHGIRVNAVAPRANTRMSAAHSDSVAAQLSIPDDVMATINAGMPPELCAPAAAFLAHEDCRLNGEVLQVGMGGVARIAVVRTVGIMTTPLTAEDIAENLDAVMNISEAQVAEVTQMVL